MKAMIFAAGLGTRLRPLTENTPKALIKVKGITLLERAIKKVTSNGFNDLIVNVHHFPDQVIDFLKENKNFGANITISDERETLLDTGGGLKKASWFFDDGKPFLLYNVDIATDIDLQDLYNFHLKSNNPIATLAVKKRKTNRYFLFDQQNVLCGWQNAAIDETKLFRYSETELTPLGFSGIHIIDPRIFQYIKHEGVFSIVGVYQQVAPDEVIKGYNHDQIFWMDLGKKESLEEAEKIPSL